MYASVRLSQGRCKIIADTRPVMWQVSDLNRTITQLEFAKDELQTDLNHARGELARWRSD